MSDQELRRGFCLLMNGGAHVLPTEDLDALFDRLGEILSARAESNRMALMVALLGIRLAKRVLDTPWNFKDHMTFQHRHWRKRHLVTGVYSADDGRLVRLVMDCGQTAVVVKKLARKLLREGIIPNRMECRPENSCATCHL